MLARSFLPLIVWTGLGVILPCCKNESRPPPYSVGGGEGGANTTIDLGLGGAPEDSSAPPEDLSHLCGNQLLPIRSERPNLYFVLDRSGSMNDWMTDPPENSENTKYESSVQAIRDVLFSVGHRVAYGAAVFPSLGNIEDCSAGNEIDTLRAGDSVTYARNELEGPHLTSLLRVLRSYRPEGATPTSATLEQLLPTLLELKGETSVVLTTDGAPNCNPFATCSAATCIANIEEAVQMNGTLCDATVNCCAPAGDYGPYSCIDADATFAPLAELFAHGIKTYIIGLPGTDAYQDTMNQMADAGGTARERITETAPKYYRVEDAKALATALKSIAANLAISCTVELESPPPDWSQVNVYFDNGIVKFDEKNGWKRVDSNTLELVGESCSSLRSGDVFQVQVVFGCATVTLQ